MLCIGIGLVVWWYMEAANYDTMLDGVPFAKGANLIYDPAGTPADNTVTMSCPTGKQVCVYQATQICTNPTPGNYETLETDPIITDASNPGWSKFNPDTTVNLTQALNAACGVVSMGAPVTKGTCQYVFNPTSTPFTAPMTCGGATHLIANYTCEPAGAPCNSTS